MAQTNDNDDNDVNNDNNDDGDTSNIATLLGVIANAYLFQIPPKTSSMGHMADTWPKKAMWVGRLKIMSTATECTLQFENIDTDKVYLKVAINNDPDKPSTYEPAADSSRYFALNLLKPGTNQYFELGLGFQTRDESYDFKMAVGEFERMKQNLEESKKFNMAPKENFSLGDDEVLDMKPMKNKKKKENDDNQGGGGGDALFMPPPPDKQKKKHKHKKKKKKNKNNNDDNNNDGGGGDDLFGDFTGDTHNNNNNDNNDNGWATFE